VATVLTVASVASLLPKLNAWRGPHAMGELGRP